MRPTWKAFFSSCRRVLRATNRYYSNAYGRFMKPDPYKGSTPLPIQFNDMYSYAGPTAAGAGLPSAKRLQVNEVVYYRDINNQLQHKTVPVNLDSTYTYNNEGKITAMTYPSTINGSGTSVPGASYNYSYDTMYRLSGMTDSNNNTIVSGVSYNPANQLLGMTFNGVAESRSYNVLNQLTNVHAGSSENLTYNYPTGTNNGKVSSMYNAVSGETVTYTYDSLNRMATAAGNGWGEAYTFDPFGNLTTKQVTSGSGPSLSQAVNQSNNQIVGQSYDANGNALVANAAYDVENHIYALVGGPPYTSYSYDAQGKRIFLWNGTVDGNNNPTTFSVIAYAASGQKLGTYQCIPGTYYSGGNYVPFIGVSVASSDQYFGGRRLAVMDQLGSAGTYYPWGEAKGTTNPQDTWSYATYWRDSATGLDYANNRYYSNAYGRFMTPDPYQSNVGGPGDPSDPGSWNKYAYTRGDPVNRKDPWGLDDENGDNPDGGDGGGNPGPAPQGGRSPQPAPVRSNFNSAFPPCNKTDNQGVENELNFIVNNYATAASAAQTVDSAFNTNITASLILAWAGQESTWGTNNPFNGEDYNQATGANWFDQATCPANANTKWACFSSFQNSTLSAFFSPFLVTYTAANGQTFTHASAGFILSDQLAQGATLAAAFQMVASGQGATGGWDHNNTAYGTNVQKTLNGLGGHLDCLKKYGYVH
jgi:RHS repeat-associated protein